MKRASYREAIRWIAANDAPGDPDALDPNATSHLVTSCLVADLFGLPDERVGRDIVRERERAARERKKAQRASSPAPLPTSVVAPSSAGQGPHEDEHAERDAAADEERAHP